MIYELGTILGTAVINVSSYYLLQLMNSFYENGNSP